MWFSDTYILVKGTITVENNAAQGQPKNAANKEVIFKNCALVTNCISRINNTLGDDAHDIDVVMPMYDALLTRNALLSQKKIILEQPNQLKQWKQKSRQQNH